MIIIVYHIFHTINNKLFLIEEYMKIGQMIFSIKILKFYI